MKPVEIERVASRLDGRTLKDIADDLKHEVTWLGRLVHEIHGDQGGKDEQVSSLRRAVVALLALTEDVYALRVETVTVKADNSPAPDKAAAEPAPEPYGMGDDPRERLQAAHDDVQILARALDAENHDQVPVIVAMQRTAHRIANALDDLEGWAPKAAAT